jgi:hypothetical protein
MVRLLLTFLVSQVIGIGAVAGFYYLGGIVPALVFLAAWNASNQWAANRHLDDHAAKEPDVAGMVAEFYRRKVAR